MKSLVIVDIQPFYHQYHRDITPKLLKHIKVNISKYENIIWFYHAEEVIGIEETIDDMNEYIGDFDILTEDEFESIIFIDKDFGFFIDWIDSGVDGDFIKDIVKHMIRKGVNDSREIDEESFKILFQTFFNISNEDIEGEWSDEYGFFQEHAIAIPQFKWDAIKGLKNVDLCGGSRNKCLAEIEILLESLDVEVNKLDNFIYMAHE